MTGADGHSHVEYFTLPIGTVQQAAANTLYILEWQRQVWLQKENQEQPGRQLNA